MDAIGALREEVDRRRAVEREVRGIDDALERGSPRSNRTTSSSSAPAWRRIAGARPSRSTNRNRCGNAKYSCSSRYPWNMRGATGSSASSSSKPARRTPSGRDRNRASATAARPGPRQYRAPRRNRARAVDRPSHRSRRGTVAADRARSGRTSGPPSTVAEGVRRRGLAARREAPPAAGPAQTRNTALRRSRCGQSVTSCAVRNSTGARYRRRPAGRPRPAARRGHS